MKVTKNFETPTPPRAVGVTIEMDMVEANRIRWALEKIIAEGPAVLPYTVHATMGGLLKEITVALDLGPAK